MPLDGDHIHSGNPGGAWLPAGLARRHGIVPARGLSEGVVTRGVGEGRIGRATGQAQGHTGHWGKGLIRAVTDGARYGDIWRWMIDDDNNDLARTQRDVRGAAEEA